jgi:hypothetical protein
MEENVTPGERDTGVAVSGLLSRISGAQGADQGEAALHHAFHSFPVLLCGVVVARAICGRWAREELMAWGLHILIDIPSHSRRR